MRTYLLDTNILSYAMNGAGKVLSKMAAKSPEAIFISVISEAELRFGVVKTSSPTRSLHHLEAMLKPLQKLEFTSKDAVTYADVRAKLERAGKPIGPLDTLIGAHALSRDMTLVTNNEREFKRIAGLQVENWSS